MTSRAKRSEEIRVRLHPGQDDDLLHWLAQFDSKPYGAKTQAVKETLRRGLGMGDSEPSSESPASSTGAALDLSELRQVVEAAVDTALGRFEGQIDGGTKVKSSAEDDETEALLDNLEAALVLEEAA
jgi:hypothetical protein